MIGRARGLLCGALILAGPALGQNATAQTTTAAAGGNASGGNVLQEVVVTAERRATDIMSTPISIVAVSGDQLQQTQVVDINSLGQVAPNLVIYTTGASSTADIRGVGNSNQGGIEQPGIAIIRDGLPNNTEGTGANAPYFDIADVEVLRGPQGTFAGDNSTGGAINITSANPNFRGINGYINAQVATYSEQRAQVAVNLPVTDTLALRLAVNEETRGSFFRDVYSQVNGPYGAGPYLCPGAYPCLGVTGIGPTYPVAGNKALYDPGNVDDKDMRLGILWQPTDNFQSLTKIEFDYEDSHGVPSQPDIGTFNPLPGKPCPAGEGTAPNCYNIWAPGYSGSPYVRNDWYSSGTLWNDDVMQISEQLQYTTASGIQYRLIAGDQEISDNTVSSTSNDILNVGSYGNTINRSHVYSGELDILSPTTGPFSWVTGANITYTGEEFASYSTNTNAPYSMAAPSHAFYIDGEYITPRNEGIFGQVSWQFTHTLQLVAGLRNGWDSEVALGGLGIFQPGGRPLAFSNQPIGGPPSDRVVTGKVDLNWTPLPGQYFYGFMARGYKPGEENLGVNRVAHYEYVNDYELGWKGRLAGGHVLVQLGGYYMQYMDMIHSVFDPQIPRSTNESSIPFSILKGIEASMQANVGHLSINLNGAYNKSILGPFTDAATYAFPSGTEFGTTAQCAPGVAPDNSPNGCSDYTGSYPGDPSYDVTLSGESLPYSPEYSGNGTLQYSIPVGSTMSIVPRVSYSYVSKTYSDIWHQNFFLLPGHSLWGAYLDWNAGAWTTTLYGTNLANTVYLEGNGNSGALYGNPRQLGMKVNYTF